MARTGMHNFDAAVSGRISDSRTVCHNDMHNINSETRSVLKRVCRTISRICTRVKRLLQLAGPKSSMKNKVYFWITFKKTFFLFLSCYGRVWLQSWQKMLTWPPKFLFELASKLPKNANMTLKIFFPIIFSWMSKKAEFMLISNPLKSCKKVPTKQYCVRKLFSAL